MSFIEFCKRNLMSYFIIVTGITAAVGILGTNYDANAVFGYEAFYSPLIIGAVSILPSFVLYSRKDLTFKQMLVRRILHFILLELILVTLGFVVGLFDENHAAFPFAISVFLVYVFVQFMIWISDCKTADAMNEGLKRLQG
ncbi:MAG: hypothetical protein K0S47_4207 [Herbinix sp.]|jgi:hypothetical protein|nr:hypothetical protein [Herbinix sp.]